MNKHEAKKLLNEMNTEYVLNEELEASRLTRLGLYQLLGDNMPYSEVWKKIFNSFTRNCHKIKDIYRRNNCEIKILNKVKKDAIKHMYRRNISKEQQDRNQKRLILIDNEIETRKKFVDDRSVSEKINDMYSNKNSFEYMLAFFNSIVNLPTFGFGLIGLSMTIRNLLKKEERKIDKWHREHCSDLVGRDREECIKYAKEYGIKILKKAQRECKDEDCDSYFRQVLAKISSMR